MTDETTQASGETALDLPATELMITLMGQNARDAAHGFRELAEDYKAQYEEARDELERVRAVITALCGQPWAPNPALIEEALYDSYNPKWEHYLRGEAA
jgi:hypothetical protein